MYEQANSKILPVLSLALHSERMAAEVTCMNSCLLTTGALPNIAHHDDHISSGILFAPKLVKLQGKIKKTADRPQRYPSQDLPNIIPLQ